MHNSKIVRCRGVGDILHSPLLPDLPVFKLNPEYLFCRISRSEGLYKIHIQADSLLGLIYFPAQHVNLPANNQVRIRLTLRIFLRLTANST